MSKIEDEIKRGIEERKPLSSLLQETLGEVNFITRGGCQDSKYFFSDSARAMLLTNCIAMIRDYAKQLENEKD